MTKLPALRAALLSLGLVALTGCWNPSANELHLGDVSLGQQLIDLQRALKDEALTAEEYAAAKTRLLDGIQNCDADNAVGIRIGEEG